MRLPVRQRWLTLGIAVVVGALQSWRGPSLFLDSASYIAHSPIRPPLYPLLLDIVHFAFRSHYLRAVVFLQALLGMLTVFHLVERLRGRFGLSWMVQAGVFVVLAAAPLNYSRDVASEALTYSLFLMMVACALDAMFDPSDRHVLSSVAWAGAAILTRTQILFVIPIGAVGVGIVLARRSFRPQVRLVAALAVLTVSLLAIPRLNNYLRTGDWRGAGLAGIQLLTVNLYLSDRSDLALFPDADDQRVVSSLIDKLEERHLSESTRPPEFASSTYFADIYNKLCWGLIVEEYRGGATVAEMSVAELRKLDESTLRIAERLLRHHAVRVTRFVVLTIYQYFKYFAVLVVGVLLFALRFRREDVFWTVLGASCVLWFSNMILICLVEVPMTRYTGYTDSVVVALLLVAVARRSTVAPGQLA